MSVHILQKDIIDRLRVVDHLRYSELQPRDIESSHFKYHLDQLITDGFVERQSRGIYALTQKGSSFTDRLSEHHTKPSAMPKLITYTLLEDSDSYYLLKKNKEPYRGLLNMIGGKLHLGETPEQAAEREIAEKVHLTLTDLSLGGVATIRIHKNDQLFTHVTAYIFTATISEPSPQLVKVDKQTIAERTDLAPDLVPLLEMLQTSPTPFISNLSLSL